MSYFQPNGIYVLVLVKFVFLEISSNCFLIYFFTLLQFYGARISHVSHWCYFEIICTVKSVLKRQYTSELPGEFTDFQLCSHPSPFPTFWFSMWEKDLRICIFAFSFFLKQVLHRFPFEHATLKKPYLR